VSNLRDKIRSAQDRNSESVEIPEWDVTVEVRSMTGRQRSRIMSALDSEGADRLNAFWGDVIVSCVHDPETGEPVFGDEDVEWLVGEKSSNVLDTLSGACLRISGIIDGAVDEAGKDSSVSPTDKDG
jgi:hypothetical protein